ncbi:MAG: ABC transporter substrate-binding protein [Planctomycetes bacterium]|nr:ABC transporter substrate-binding protein [Planctomycetota bacterium]
MLQRNGLLFLAVTVVLFGLQVSTVAQPAPPVPAPVAPAKPAAEGTKTLRIAFSPSESPTLDPHAARDPFSFRLIATAYETLYMWAPGEHPHVVPCLAKDFPQVSEDGLTVTIKVDTDAKFHSSECFGEERTRNLKASDVVHSFKRLAVYGDNGMYWLIGGLIQGLDEYASKARYDMNYETTDTKVEGLTAPDDGTVVIKLTRPYAPLVTMLAHPSFSIIAREAIDHYSGMLDERMVGTGPYRLNAVADGRLYVFKGWDDYRGEKPVFKRVTFTRRNYWNEFIEGFQSGQFQEMPMWADYYDRVVKDGKPAGVLAKTATEVVQQDEHGYYFLAFNMEDPIWGAMDDDGRALRKAVSLCIDRKQILEDAGWTAGWNGAQEDLFPTGMEFEDADDELAYGKSDIALAKKTLNASKYKGGVDPSSGDALTLSFLIYDTSRILEQYANLYNQLIVNLRSGLKALGMKLDVRYLDTTNYREEVTTADEQLFVSGWFLDYPDPANFLQLFWSENAKTSLEFNNASRYHSPEFDKRFLEYESLAPVEGNLARRRELVSAMAGEIAKDQPTIPLVHKRTIFLRNTGTQEWPQMPRQTYNDIRFVKETDK